MITAGLGFAALENSLFLFDLVKSGDSLVNIVLTGNMRFLGASVLHIISSGIIGVFIALSYYKKKEIKKRYLLSGLILAITLHSIFNSFIIRSDGFTLVAFAMSWLVALFLILYVEKIKNKKLQA
jgi:RsiW-degrading membrane proteinase PrsW (M82 family)